MARKFEFAVGDWVLMSKPMNRSIPPGSVGCVHEVNPTHHIMPSDTDYGACSVKVHWKNKTSHILDETSGWYACQFEIANEYLRQKHLEQLQDHASYYTAITEWE